MEAVMFRRPGSFLAAVRIAVVAAAGIACAAAGAAGGAAAESAGAAAQSPGGAAGERPAPPPPELDAAMQEALTRLMMEKYAEAIPLFEAVVEKWPDTGVAWGSLGIAYQKEGRYPEAIRSYEKAIEFDGSRMIAMYNLACLHSLTGDADRSLQWLGRAIDEGFRNAEQLVTDPDLANVRRDPRFEEMMIRAGAHPRPCQLDPRHRALDFWLGQWDVFRPDGHKAGTSSILKLLKDCAILESWVSATDDSQGVSVNYFDPGTGKWRQDWVADRGYVIHYEGELRDGSMRFEGKNVDHRGRQELSRMTLTPRDDGTVAQKIEQSKDGGTTWYVWFEGNYVPRKEEKAEAPAPAGP
jgi:tetratricopeptide (TPR) repeat protein